MSKFVALCVSLAVTASAVLATPTINVGTHNLAPNTANQIITINITGGDQLQNVDFSVQIGDGGTAVGGTAGPRLTNVDILTGTIFASNNTGRASGTTNGLIYPQIGYEGTTTATDTSGNTTYVAANGILATLTIDTTGFTSGSWALLLTGTLNGDTAFANTYGTGYLATSITNGTISIVQAFHPGDANGDGVVTDADYTLWADNYGTPSATWAMGDFNADGTVTDADYTIWADHYGHTSQSPVPEPATLSLLGLGLLGLIRRK